ncbi:MAG: class I SAM-dependent methyltransferase [Bacteroidia bacterium]|nr:class I SAM-dependent methyltransferase [Bacteroidia bacterium]
MQLLEKEISLLETYRNILLSLYPELKEMTENLPKYNPEYYAIASIPAQVIQYLCEKDSQRIVQSIQAYIRFCDTFKQKQIEFIRNQSYAYQDFEQVNKEVYQNQNYMAQTYYPALLFSYLFSSNYFEILRVFCQYFIPLTQTKQGKSCEIGIGHGLLSALLLSRNSNLQGVGIDISPVAQQVSARVSKFFGLTPIPVCIEDATHQITQKNNQVMICAEVLEHLPQPQQLLENIYAALAENGLLFLTASINMESVDHLYWFENDMQVQEMVEKTSFKIVQKNIAFLTSQDYRNNPSLQNRLMKRKNPCTVIFILTK